jgi:hypothetical protein
MLEMLELTHYLGSEVRDAGKKHVGTLIDFAALLEDPYPIVSRIRVRVSRKSAVYLPSSIVDLDETGIRLRSGWKDDEVAYAGANSVHADELLLAEHILDAQIIDTDDKRVVRVGEVELEFDGDSLFVVGVEVGRAAILRRLGLRKLSSRVPRELVDWRDLHVVSGRGHALQLRTTAARMHRLGPSELAHLVSQLPLHHGADVLRAVDPKTAAGALGATHPDLRNRLIRELGPEEAPVTAHDAQAPSGAKASPIRRRFGKVLSVRRRAPS